MWLSIARRSDSISSNRALAPSSRWRTLPVVAVGPVNLSLNRRNRLLKVFHRELLRDDAQLTKGFYRLLVRRRLERHIDGVSEESKALLETVDAGFEAAVLGIQEAWASSVACLASFSTLRWLSSRWRTWRRSSSFFTTCVSQALERTSAVVGPSALSPLNEVPECLYKVVRGRLHV